jgi:hypothetical protein
MFESTPVSINHFFKKNGRFQVEMAMDTRDPILDGYLYCYGMYIG